MIWFPQHMSDLVSCTEIFPFFRSDHSYVFAEFRLPDSVSRGPRVSLFGHELLRQLIHEFWSDWQTVKWEYSSLAIWWDVGKSRLKDIIRRYGRSQSSEHKQKMIMLESSLYHVDRRIRNGAPLRSVRTEIEQDLQAELLREAKGAQLRARVQWAEEGETSSKYFLRLEKSKGQSKLIRRVRQPDGVIVDTTSEIQSVFSDFYANLFSSQPLDLGEQTIFLQSLERRLDASTSCCCDGLVTETECLTALKAMSKNKTPGTDDFPAEFFLSLWSLLGQDLVEVLKALQIGDPFRCCVPITRFWQRSWLTGSSKSLHWLLLPTRPVAVTLARMSVFFTTLSITLTKTTSKLLSFR